MNSSSLVYIGKVLTCLSIFALQSCSDTKPDAFINLMTYNIRYDNPQDSLDNWKHRKDDIVSLIEFYKCEIIGIQEGLFHQVQFLDQELEDFAYVGIGRDDGKIKGEYCAIFIDTTTFRINKSGTFWLSETPDKVSVGWDASMERICTWVEVTSRLNENQMTIYNTHFDHRGSLARLNSAELILKKMESSLNENKPVALMGDFNLSQETEVISLLRQKMIDPFLSKEITVYGPVGTFNGFNLQAKMDTKIDYIFINDNQLKPILYQTIDDRAGNSFPSDHLPVTLKLKWETK